MNNKPLILVIDDESTILKTLKEILEEENFLVETLSDGNKAIDAIGKLIPDLVLLDIFMPNCNGINLLEQIKTEYPQQKIIMISGFGSITIAVEALKKGALDFIEKPLNLDEILSKINFLKNKNLKQEKNKNNQQDLKDFGIVGSSYLFLELIQQINKIINLKFPLLIYGEHGTGKSLLTKYIHKNSNLKDKKLVTINCSNLQQKEFIEKIEDFYSNKKGTLYIKHINNLDLNSQKKLLKIIEKNEALTKKHNNLNNASNKISTKQLSEINNLNKTRLIVSSTTSIYKLIKSNLFNSSLYYKLNVTPLEIPPLNKRKYDIPLFCDYFLNKENKKSKKNVVLSTKAIRLLRNHNWTANVLELKNLIERIVITSKTDNVVTDQELITLLGEKQTQLIEEQSFLRFSSLKQATTEFEKNYLLYLLKKNKFDLKQTSDLIDLTTIQLRDKLLKLNIDLKQG
jgi:two-component system, NtrC family, nitrogen regulation response regulator NtrX